MPVRACGSIKGMSEPSYPDERLSTTSPDLLTNGAPTDALPLLEGVPSAPLTSEATHNPVGDAGLDLDLDIDFATAAMDTAPQALAPLSTPTRPVLLPFPSHPQPARGFSVDSGQTLAGTSGFPWQDRRVLVVSADVDERVYLRARLALAKLVWVDEAATTTQAEGAMNTHRYLMAIFNLDVPVVDGLALAKRFRQTHPEAVCVVTGAASPSAGPLGLWGRWHQWRREQELQGTGVEWLAKPLLPKKAAQLFTRVHNQRAAKQK
jgi:CheY-like chemotaxis protein